MEPFTGFPEETFLFLTDLSSHNEKAWFDDNRARYDEYFLRPALAFVDALAPYVSALNPPHKAAAKINGSLRRIHRDIRFSKDKTPFSPRMHLVFWTGDHPNRSPAIHIVLHPDSYGFGAGQWGLDKDQLHRFRQSVCDADTLTSLEAALAQASSVGCDLDQPDLKRVPAGYDASDATMPFLLRKSLVTRTMQNRDLPPTVGTPEFVQTAADTMKSLAPVNDWLLTHVSRDP